MFIPDPGAEFFYPGSRVTKIPDRHQKISVFLTLKIVSQLLKIIWDAHPGTRIPGPDSDFFHPGPRGQTCTGSRIPIRNTEVLDNKCYSPAHKFMLSCENIRLH
jgi:hypothetical protein